MRNSFIIFLLIGAVALGLGLFNSLANNGNVIPKSQPVSASSPAVGTFGITQKTVEVANPLKFTIPKLGVQNAQVESVGLDKQGKMDIPKDEDNVAWYNLGAKPGERGNAVIAGHFDKKTGAPAVFYQINKLKPGDELIVTDQENKQHIYAVTEIKSYELSEFPLEEVFGAGDKSRLNLITCEGTFNTESRLYSHRLVVYSELKS